MPFKFFKVNPKYKYLVIFSLLEKAGNLRFTAVGTNTFSAYNEWYVSWLDGCRTSYDGTCKGIKGRIVRPNIECTNG